LSGSDVEDVLAFVRFVSDDLPLGASSALSGLNLPSNLQAGSPDFMVFELSAEFQAGFDYSSFEASMYTEVVQIGYAHRKIEKTVF